MRLQNVFAQPQARSKKYEILNEVLGAVTHGIGFCLAVAATVLLVIKAARTGSPIRIVSFTVFGVSLMTLYLFSTLYHALIFTRARHVFQVFDHSSIFFLIAGTYTPYTLVAIGRWQGWTMFGIIWALAIGGILYKIFNVGKHVIVDVLLYILMGWIVILASSPLYQTLGPTGFWLLVWGGIAYTVGALFYSMRNLPFIHVIWHLFVMLGSGLMFFSVYLFV